MDSINYHEYSQYTCDKCKDTYHARYARVSDRTSCRYHHYIIYNNEKICRDCERVEGHNQNCHHISTPSCCFQ